MFSKLANHVVTMYPNLDQISFIFVLKAGEPLPLRDELANADVSDVLMKNFKDLQKVLEEVFPDGDVVGADTMVMDAVRENDAREWEEEWIVYAMTIGGQIVRLTTEETRESAEGFAEAMLRKMGLQFSSGVSGSRLE